MSHKEVKSEEQSELNITRRSVLGASAVLAGAGIVGSQLIDPLAKTAYAAGSDAPIKIGFQAHRTGIGALYGRWYERTTNAAAKYINSIGGIAGRPIEIITEDDGTDPKRGADVVEKLATHHKVDFVFGTLFSHVVMGSAPR
ncbi:MAG: ABC transporter substrate-binding protein, partial [SAR324 cluster bacterium]